jgi:hypothetical protein
VKNLQEASERICELKGSLVALDALLPALFEALPSSTHARLMESFEARAEAARTVLLHADISDLVLAAFERDVARNRVVLQHGAALRQGGDPERPAAVDPLLRTTTRITTHTGNRVLTSASGFYFRRGERLFLVSNRHVFADAPSAHGPDRIEIGVHTDPDDLTRHTRVSLPLYDNGLARWRAATDSGGEVDVAVIAIEPAQLPPDAVLAAFDETHLEPRGEVVAIGDALGIVGFPLGFHDTMHHLAVSRNASIASAYGVRFQQQGCFLTDARTHRGSSGAPVVRRRMLDTSGGPPRAWQLIGVHSTRMDMRTRDHAQDESLGLNLAWYADILETLTTPA